MSETVIYKEQKLSFHSFGYWKSKITMLVGLVSGKNLISASGWYLIRDDRVLRWYPACPGSVRPWV
jgi:hypothetical protein